jgi:hypothetical protein
VRAGKEKSKTDSRSRESPAEKGKSRAFILSLLERERQNHPTVNAQQIRRAPFLADCLSPAGDGGSYNG